MKYLFISLLFIACNTKTKFVKHPPDTSFITITYAYDWDRNDYRTVTSRRVLHDTMLPVTVDETTSKLQWVRDTAYHVILVDTAREKDGKVKVDSLNKPVLFSYWAELPDVLIVKDYNKKWPPQITNQPIK